MRSLISGIEFGGNQYLVYFLKTENEQIILRATNKDNNRPLTTGLDKNSIFPASAQSSSASPATATSTSQLYSTVPTDVTSASQTNKKRPPNSVLP